MKVVHLISGGETGGSKNHLLTLLDQFPSDQVSLVVMQQGVLYDEAKKLGIDVHLLDQRSRYDLSILSRLKELIKKNGFQLIHTHGARANLYASILKNSLRIPWVTTIHSDPTLDFLKGGMKGKIFTKINLWTIKRIDHFFAVSERFKEDLINLGVPSEKITTVYNGIDFSKSYATKTLTRADLDLQADDFVTAMVARLHPIKGHEEVFQAIRQLDNPPFKLLLIGDGPEKEHLTNRVRELGIASQVQFLGFRHDVPDIYQISDIGLLASYSESFPLALLEAAREHTPVVATDVGGVRHMVQGTGWVVSTKSANELTDAFQKAIEKKKIGELSDLGETFYEHCSANFSLDQLADSTKKMYKKFLQT
ncbi:glycosyltransferase [Pontibacillus yanchengensis]|uniref:Glycosyl transferase n=1 Tax=Pontibacillus yanchengensis Y32 TaxID=1385514 RepID=A0A0A2TJB6_9BACI|nr:glycosyltransferase [Pontibacillus yanchengensis]KGP74533.1 glycosyl transferase [Pontibacillus yanchengensis Y32]